MASITGGPEAGPATDPVTDGHTSTFQADVIDASREVPVIVDFWAPWCGPCRQLGPMLERAVRAAGGRVRLVKVNTDECPELAQAFQVRSIPAVHAVVDGRPVDGFVGVVPESEVQAFVARLAGEGGPSALDEALDHAARALEAGDAAGAEAVYAQILGEVPDHAAALAGAARCRLAAGDAEGARALLERVPPDRADDREVAGARAALAVAEQAAAGAGDRAALAARVEADPNDHQARFDLALAHLAAGDRARAVDELLEIVRRDRGWNDGAARKQLLTLFEAMGEGDPLTAEGRRRLSAVLFS